MQTSIDRVAGIDRILLISEGVSGVEQLVETLLNSRKLNFSGDNGTSCTVQLNNFVVKFYRRQSSSNSAKVKRYAYRGQIHFRYGPDNKHYQVPLIFNKYNESRSLKALIEKNMIHIVARARQHFKLNIYELRANKFLARYV